MTSKKFTILFPSLVLLSVLFSCTSNSKIFEENPPFTVKEATFQNWFSGAQEFGRGIHVFLEMETIAQDVLIDSIYFRGMADVIQRDTNNPLKYIANLKTMAKQDVIMHENPIKEINNSVPDIKKDFLFNLDPKEAVISYRKNNKRYYYKVTHLNEIEPLNYPSTNSRENNN